MTSDVFLHFFSISVVHKHTLTNEAQPTLVGSGISNVVHTFITAKNGIFYALSDLINSRVEAQLWPYTYSRFCQFDLEANAHLVMYIIQTGTCKRWNGMESLTPPPPPCKV